MGSRIGATTTSLAAAASPKTARLSSFQLHILRDEISHTAIPPTYTSEACLKMARRSSWSDIQPRDAKPERAASCPPRVAGRITYAGDSYFCDVCLDIFELRRPIVDQNKYEVEMRHHQDHDSFRKAAEAGCWICERLWHHWTALGWDGEADCPALDARVGSYSDGIAYASFSCGSLSPTMAFDLWKLRADDRSEYDRSKTMSFVVAMPLLQTLLRELCSSQRKQKRPRAA